MPRCVQCTATKRALKDRGLDYTEIDVTEDPDALAFVKDLGYQAAPVVYTSRPDPYTVIPLDPPKPATIREHWTQFRPDLIAQIVK